MTAFYVCIILIGIMMVAVAMIWMVIERKNNRDYRLEIDEKRYELQHLIEDAEQLLDELNNFSGYVVTQMEEKQKDMEEAVKAADERLDLFANIKEIPDNLANSMQDFRQEQEKIDIKIESDEEEPPETLQYKKGKIIPFDLKKREVIKLSRDGMGSEEIARLLNMGKGEIELISRISQG